jgi:hypothetical protein
MRILTIICCLISLSTAFHVERLPKPRTSRRFATTEEEHHITFDPVAGYKGVDVERAKECAEHFGKCDVKEIQELRDSKCHGAGCSR